MDKLQIPLTREQIEKEFGATFSDRQVELMNEFIGADNYSRLSGAANPQHATSVDRLRANGKLDGIYG